MDRKEILKRRKDVQNREQKEKAIAQAILPFLKGKIGLYNPIGSEVNILRYVDYKNAYYPVCIENYELEFYPYSKQNHLGTWNIPEPERVNKIDPIDFDVIIVPMVGFYKVQRIGYGKGYYDRYLSKTNALKIGIAFDEQECAPFEKKETDIDMDFVITPTRKIG